jgi:hypothetical protein
MSSPRFPPSILACRLYQRVSANGRPYLVGSLGGLTVAVLATGEVSESGQPIWEMKFSERQSPDASRSYGQSYPPRPRAPSAKMHSQRPLMIDAVPASASETTDVFADAKTEAGKGT